MEIHRSRNQHGFHRTVGQKLPVILVGFRGASDGELSLLEALVVDIADRHAIAVIDALQQPEKILAAAARADDSVIDLIVRGVDALQKRGRLRFRGFRETYGNTCSPGGFDGVTPGNSFFYFSGMEGPELVVLRRRSPADCDFYCNSAAR